ncbi:class I SAM-dependent methyltransferase [Lentibacillus sediminis]|uniref:class I SAM-dependent methyltransferase n=1 Tax=Lentibacillus sediminis TaxID=1940529 RepID=UPI003B845795
MGDFRWEREAEAAWDGRAEFWHSRSEKMWERGSRKDILPFIEKHLQKGSRVLDIGCGDGYGTLKLCAAGYQASGMDLSSEMIALAKERAGLSGVSFLQGDVSELPYEDASLDAVMAINVLEWTASPMKALGEMSRVVKEGGLIFAGILGPTAGPRANSYPRLHGEPAICNTMMPWEFGQLAGEQQLAYIDGFGVYKEGVKQQHYQELSLELQQALTFMWVFMLRKEGETDG